MVLSPQSTAAVVGLARREQNSRHLAQRSSQMRVQPTLRGGSCADGQQGVREAGRRAGAVRTTDALSAAAVSAGAARVRVAPAAVPGVATHCTRRISFALFLPACCSHCAPTTQECAAAHACIHRSWTRRRHNAGRTQAGATDARKAVATGVFARAARLSLLLASLCTLTPFLFLRQAPGDTKRAALRAHTGRRALTVGSDGASTYAYNFAPASASGKVHLITLGLKSQCIIRCG